MRVVVLFILCLLNIDMFADIRINEVMQSNVNGIIDELNEYPDSWVELYNEDTTAFDFTAYSISRSKDFTESFPLMDTTIIPPKGYLLIYCDKEEDRGVRHADFRIDSEGETLYVFDPVGHIVDSLEIPEMLAPDISYGRITDGNDTLTYFKKASPNAPNGGFHTTKILKKPDFSVKGGIYNHPVVLRLGLQGDYPSDAVVRYTLNGGEPTEDSPTAPDSMVITSTTVVRAKTFSDSALSKLSKTETYIIPDREYTLPIVSIVTDSVNLYGDETGILVEGTYGITHPDIPSDIPELGNMNFLYSWNRPGNIEYFDLKAGNQSVINQVCEVEIGGNTSACLPIKSLNVRANKRFGESKFSYPFWSDKPHVAKSKSLYLRNSGQDFNCLHFRDAMNQMSFGQHVDVDWQASQPVVVLINGKYYGLLNLREKVNADFVWSNYNKLEDIDMVVENNYQVKAGDLTEYARYRILVSDSLTTLRQIDSLIDLNEFMNYFVLSIVYCNKDFPANNQILWRKRSDTAKWRYIIKDTDVTAGLIFNSVWDYPYFNYILRKEPFTEEGTNSLYSCRVFMKTMSFPEIVNQVIDRLSVYMGTFVSAESCMERLDSLAEVIAPEIPYFYNEIGRNTNDWEYWKNQHKEYMQKRIPFLYKHTSEFFGLGDTASVKISSLKSKVYFNGVLLNDGRFDGRFYYGRPIYLSASDTAFRYVGDSVVITKDDSVSRKEDGRWLVTYTMNGGKVEKKVYGKSLYFIIPEGAKSVEITEYPPLKGVNCDTIPVLHLAVESLDCGVPVEQVPTILEIGPGDLDYTKEVSLQASNDTLRIGENEVSWVFSDLLGDTTVCGHTIVVDDQGAPVLKTCSNMDTLVLYLAANQSRVLSEEIENFAPVADDNCSGKVTGVLDESRDTFYVGESVALWKFSDVQGNESQCLQTVVVKDTLKPVVERCDSLPSFQLYASEDKCYYTVSEVGLHALPASDNCGGVNVTTFPSDTLFVGENELWWVYTDEAGNSTRCAQLITVIDEYAPVYKACDSMPELRFVVEGDACGLKISEMQMDVPVAEDNCSKQITGQLISKEYFFIGESIVYWLFKDGADNQLFCPQKIVVTDKHTPVYELCEDLPPMTFLIKDGQDGYAKDKMNLSVPVAIDNCGAFILAENDMPEVLPVGNHEVHWTFRDQSGNELVCAQNISVEYRSAPHYEGCKSMEPVYYNLTENYCAVPFEQVELEKPIAKGMGGRQVLGVVEDAPLVLPIGETEISWLFSDTIGYQTRCKQTVIVYDRAVPYADCSKIDTLLVDLPVNADEVALELVDIPLQKAVDNCNVIVEGLLVADAFIKKGDNELRWVYVDSKGNSSYCQQIVRGVEHYTKKVYPNPVSDCLYVEGAVEGDEIVVENTLGQRMCKIRAVGNPTLVPFGRFVPGVYSVTVGGDVYKVIKK